MQEILLTLLRFSPLLLSHLVSLHIVLPSRITILILVLLVLSETETTDLQTDMWFRLTSGMWCYEKL